MRTIGKILFTLVYGAVGILLALVALLSIINVLRDAPVPPRAVAVLLFAGIPYFYHFLARGQRAEQREKSESVDLDRDLVLVVRDAGEVKPVRQIESWKEELARMGFAAAGEYREYKHGFMGMSPKERLVDGMAHPQWNLYAAVHQIGKQPPWFEMFTVYEDGTSYSCLNTAVDTSPFAVRSPEHPVVSGQGKSVEGMIELAAGDRPPDGIPVASPEGFRDAFEARDLAQRRWFRRHIEGMNRLDLELRGELRRRADHFLSNADALEKSPEKLFIVHDRLLHGDLFLFLSVRDGWLKMLRRRDEVQWVEMTPRQVIRYAVENGLAGNLCPLVVLERPVPADVYLDASRD